MRHVPYQHHLRLARAFDVLLQVCACEGTCLLFPDDLLVREGSQLREGFAESSVGREDGCTFWYAVQDVNEVAIASAVLVQESGDGLSGGRDVGGLELPGRVSEGPLVSLGSRRELSLGMPIFNTVQDKYSLILRIDYDQDAILCRSCRCLMPTSSRKAFAMVS